METGTKISAGAHAVLLGVLLIGNPFRSEPLPFEVQDVTVISSAEFAALSAPPPVAPEVTPPVDQVPALPEPNPAPEPQPEATVPVPEVETPIETPPEPPREDVAAAPPEPEPETPPAEETTPQQAPRVAPEPAAEPEPDALPDPETQEAVTEDTGDIPRETQEATAPEAATTELVTEADQPAAPAQSLRPPSNLRPTPTAEARPPVAEAAEPAAQTPTETPAENTLSDAIADAVEQARPDAEVPLGPPLTGGEREGLRVSVSSCWNVGALSTEAQETRVTVYVAMNPDGTPQGDTIRMTDYSGGSDAAARSVFETARRAILRCGARGFPLPADKYGQWREIEMTFNPEGIFWR